MTTLEIEGQANRGNIAKADFDIKATLRHIVIPWFLLQLDNMVGQVHWMRGMLSLPFTTVLRVKDLPSDFDRLDEAYLSTSDGLEDDPLVYIGESPKQVLDAEAATDAAKPGGYYFVPGTTTALAMKLDVPLDLDYTVKGVYFKCIPFTDNTTEVNLDTYIPQRFQAALIHGLRAEIYRDRFGVGDPRFSEERGLYETFIQLLSPKKEPAPRRRFTFIR